MSAISNSKISIAVLLTVSCLFTAKYLFSKEPIPDKAAGAKQTIIYPTLVDNFYKMTPQKPHWYSASPAAAGIRQQLLNAMDSAAYEGMDKNDYHYSELKSNVDFKDSLQVTRMDRLFTDGVIAFCKDIFAGSDLNKLIVNDEISPKYATEYNTFLINKLLSLKTPEDVNVAIAALKLKNAEYYTLKRELVKQLATGNTRFAAQVSSTLNSYRWIHHFHFDKFIVVNIPSSTLRYYENNELKLTMNAVVGKPTTRTPRMGTWCKDVVLYPYWNVPDGIGVNELLPKFKKNPALMDEMNMELVDKKGKVTDWHDINFRQYSADNFPFGFRQNTGCDNSLGVIKFNLSDPFDVYLHDTNFKPAFASSKRDLSHGCIRLQKPMELAGIMLGSKLDTTFLRSCLKDQKPISMKLEKDIPVFVVYMPAEASADTVKYYKDVYKLY